MGFVQTLDKTPGPGPAGQATMLPVWPAQADGNLRPALRAVRAAPDRPPECTGPRSQSESGVVHKLLLAAGFCP